MGVNKYGERVSPYDLVAVHRQGQRTLALKRALERLIKDELKRNPYNPPRVKVPQTPHHKEEVG